jgi:exonuclease V gamma subunit
VVNESVDIIHARHILSAWRREEPITPSEQELAEGVFEHVVRELLAARGKLGRIKSTLEDRS